jgi:ubiquinone/menaquinone biosynthesis C-methylase UbiE
MHLMDDIWRSVPEDRPLDERSLRFVLETLATVPSGDRPPRVLDLGCGDGRYAARLAAAGYEVTGVDPSEEALARARRAYPQLDLTPPRPDGTLPFADNSFDAAICIYVLEHVVDTQTLLSEVRRVLVPGGRLIVAVPWHGRIKNVLIALGGFERHYDPLQPVLRFYARGSLARLLVEMGFEQIKLKGSGGIPFVRETLLAHAQRGSWRGSGAAVG